MADPLESLVKAVPDLYYDLIARLLPGGSILAAMVFTLQSDALLVEIHKKYGLWFLVFGGYVAGMILTGLSSLAFDIVLGGLASLASPNLANAIGGHTHYTRVEDVSRSYPGEATRIWKMVAEKVCLENGIVAAALLYLLPVGAATAQLTSALPLLLAGLTLAWLVRAIALQGRLEATEAPR